jgi:hypothetical protein
MSHNDADEALWQQDPYEFIRLKFDFFNDAINPSSSAAIVLTELIRKRVGSAVEK